MKTLLVLLALLAGTVQAKVLSCGINQYADPKDNCNSCFPGYTKNLQGVCVPEALSASPVLELSAPETNTTWLAGAMAALAGYPTWALLGGAFGVVAVTAGIVLELIKLRQHTESSVGRGGSSPAPARSSNGKMYVREGSRFKPV